MEILVAGGTGNVGTTVVRRLLEKGIAPRVLTRSAEKIPALPPGAHGVVGDLTQPSTLPAAFASADRLVLITALSPTETAEGLAAVDAAREAGIDRVVFMSVHAAESCPQAPHFLSKIHIATALARSGIPHTLVMPSHFFQNDLAMKEAILEYGVYPQPLGPIGMNRVDVRDIADAIVTAVLEDGHVGARYPVVGPELLSGPASAAVWTRHLGREVRYGGDDLDAWGRQMSGFLPDWLIRDLTIMFDHFQRHGLRATPEDFAAQAKILDHPPRRYDDFVGETARAWTAAVAS